MKFTQEFLSIIILFFSLGLEAKMVEIVDSGYMQQAPELIVNIVEEVAQLMDYNKPFEVIVPKKPGIAINPVNKFIAKGINPQTKNPMIIINPEWFLQVPKEQQQFLLGRAFVMFQNGTLPLSIKIAPYIFSLYSFLLLFFLFRILGWTRLVTYKKWVRILVAFIILAAINGLIVGNVYWKIIQFLGRAYEYKINEMVVAKTQNRNAGIQALELMNQAFNNEIKDNESFFKQYENIFGNYAAQLKKDSSK